MWEWAGYLCAALLLAYHSMTDLRQQYIPGKSLTIGVLLSCCWPLGRVILGTQSWPEACIGLIPGAVVLILAGIGREQIGKGDAWELIHMGNWLGWFSCLAALGIALLGVFLLSVFLLVLGRAQKSTRIPFVPFLCAGVVIRMLRFAL
ncbi:MAG: prepilin peptidase [Acetatifactor sp.]|nr:prepilin peptidase [Acetatifactor sp.]